jgi:HEPN domain-containing protein
MAGNSDKNIVKVFHWIRWGNSDYLASRSLLVGRMLVQGASLANTAVEKYLKGLCAQLGVEIPKSHKVKSIYASVKKHAPQLSGLSLRRR